MFPRASKLAVSVYIVGLVVTANLLFEDNRLLGSAVLMTMGTLCDIRISPIPDEVRDSSLVFRFLKAMVLMAWGVVSGFFFFLTSIIFWNPFAKLPQEIFPGPPRADDFDGKRRGLGRWFGPDAK
jgi:hypothetical protein